MNDKVHFFDPTPETVRDLRRAFGRYGTGVTVITTHTDIGPIGMTANSFASVSLDPPLVLWSPATGSQRHDAFAKSEHFCIHVLGTEQLELAQHFASQGHGMDVFDWEPGPGGAPVFPGCLAVFHCRTHAVHPAGDHSLILGEVMHVALREADGPGLLFDQGRFGQFSPSE